MPNYIHTIQDLQKHTEELNQYLKEQHERVDREKAQRQQSSQPRVQQSAPRSNRADLYMSDQEREFLQNQGLDTAPIENADEQMRIQAESNLTQQAHPNVSAEHINQARNFNPNQSQALDYLVSNGADENNAIEAIATGKPIKQESGFFNTLSKSVDVAEAASAKALADLGGLIPRYGYAMFGVGKDAKDWFDNISDQAGEAINRFSNEGKDVTISYNKNTGETNVDDSNSSWYQDLATGIGSFTPDLLALTASGGIGGIALVSSKEASSKAREYELTEHEENDLGDLAAATLHGIVNGTLLRYTPSAGKYVTGKLTPTMEKTFTRFANKFGVDGTKRLVANKIGNLLAREAGGIAGSEGYMVGSSLANDLTNITKDKIEGRNLHETDVVNDLADAFKDGLFWHFGGKIQEGIFHPINTAGKAYRVAGEFKNYKDAHNTIANVLRDKECTYNGENKIKQAEYKGKPYFVRSESSEKVTLVDPQTFEVKEVSKNSDYKPSNAGVKKLDTFVDNYMTEHSAPTIPTAKLNPETNKYVWGVQNGAYSRFGNVDAKHDGKLFSTYNEEGKPELRIYDADSNSMKTIPEYLYRKEINRREETPTDNVEEQPQQTVEQPTTTESKVDTIQPQAQTTDSPIDINSEDFATNYADSDGNYNVVTDNNGDKYILPNDATQPALKLSIGEEGVSLVKSDEPINPMDYEVEKYNLGSIKELVGAPTDEDANSNNVKDGNNNPPVSPTDDSGVGSKQDDVEGQGQPQQGQPQVPQQPQQPVDVPLVGKGYAINLSKGASVKEIVDEIEKKTIDSNVSKLEFALNKVKEQLNAEKNDEDVYNALADVVTELNARIETAKSLARIEEAKRKEAEKTEIERIKAEGQAERDNNKTAIETERQGIIGKFQNKQNRNLNAQTEKLRLQKEQMELQEKIIKEQTRLANALVSFQKAIAKGGDMTDVLNDVISKIRDGNDTSAADALLIAVKAIRDAKKTETANTEEVVDNTIPTETSNVEEKPTNEEGQQNVEQTPAETTPTETESKPTEVEEKPSFEDSEDLFGLQLMDELEAKQDAEGEQKFNNDLAKIHGYAREKYKVNQLNELRKSVEKDELLSTKKKTELLSRIDNLIKAHSGERLGLGVTPEEIQKLDVTGENIKTACMLLESSFRGREDQTLNQLINEIEYGKEQVESRRNEVSSNESRDYINHLLDLANERIAEVERYIKKDEKPLNEIQKKVDSLNKEIEKTEGNNYTDEYTGNEGRLTDVSFNYADGTITYKIDGKNQSKKFDSDLGYLDSIVDDLKKSLKSNNKPTPPDNNGGGKPEENGNKENSKSFVDEDSKTPVKVTTETGRKAKEALYKAIDDASKIKDANERRTFMTNFFKEKIATLGADKPTLMKVYKAFVTDGRYPLDFKGATEEQKEVKDKNTGGWHEMKTADGKETLFEHLKKISHNSSAVSKLRDNEKYKLTDVQKKEVDAAVKKLNENSHKGEDATPLLDKILHDQKNNGVSVEELIKTLKTNKKKYEEQGYNVKSFEEEIKKREQVVENKARAEKRFKEENKESKESVEEKIKRIVNTALKARRKEVDSNEDKKNMKELLDRVLDEYGRENSKTSLEDALRNAILNDKGEVTFFNSEAEVRKFGKLIGKDLSKDIAVSQAHFIACADAASIVTTREENPQNVNVVKHPLSQKSLDHLKKALEGTGLFSKVKFLSNDGIIRRFGMLAGKKAEQTLRDSNGTLLGFLGKDGTIYLNSESLDADTAVHEVAHTLFRAYENTGCVPDGFWDNATALAENCGALRELPSVYDKLPLRDRVEEALVRAIGERGGLKLQGSLWERFKDLAKHKWEEVLSFFGNEKATTNLTWRELADEYAKKITDGSFEEKERKALEKAQFDAEKCIEGMTEEIKHIGDIKLNMSNDKPSTRLWDKQNWLDRATNHYFKALNVQGLGIGKETFREKFSRYFFDTLDPVYRMMVEAHKLGAYITEGGDYADAATVSQSVIRSLSEKLTNNQVLNFENCCQDIYKIIKGKTITDKYGNDVIRVEDENTLKELISDYLICKNACNGRNKRTYEEIIKNAFDEAFGAQQKAIENNAREANIFIKKARTAIKGLDEKVSNLEKKIADADAEHKEEVKAQAEKDLRTALKEKKFILDMVREKSNNIKRYMKQKSKSQWEKDQSELPEEQRKAFEPTEEMKDFGTLGLSDRDLDRMDYSELKAKAKEVSQYVESINNYLYGKKMLEKLNNAKEEIRNDIEKDATKKPATEWLHEVWCKEHPTKAPIYDNYKDAMIKAIKDGVVQKYKTDGCGVSDRQAREFCSRFEQLVGKEKTNSLSERAKAITNYSLEMARKGRLISEQEYNELKDRNEKEFYVPMRGFKYDPKDSEGDYGHMLVHDGTGADRSIVTKANGRVSESANAYKSMLNMAYSSISSARANLDVLNYYNFVSDVLARRGKQENVSEENAKKFGNLVSIGQWYRRKVGDTHWEESKDVPDLDKVGESENGLIREGDYEYMCRGGNVKDFAQRFNLNQSKAKSHAVNVYIDGKKASMMFSEERVANAFNKTSKRLNSLIWRGYIDIVKRLTSMQSKWLTSYSIRFALANHERDLGTYFLRLSGNGYKNVGSNFMRAYSDMFNAIILGKDPTITHNGKTYSISEILNENGLATGYIETNKQNSANGLRNKIDEFRTDNGPRYKRDTDNTYLKEVEKTFKDKVVDTEKDIARLADKATPDMLQSGMKATFEAFGKAVEIGKVPPELISRMAECLELVPRYAAFRTALDNGATYEQAIRFGKNITTNFNRSGDLKYNHLGMYLYAHVPFFNAAMQGIKMAHDMVQGETSRTAKVMIGMLALGLITEELERKWYGKNSFGKDKVTEIDDYNRGSSLRIPLGHDNYLPIYMPHFFRMPLDMAMSINDFTHGDRSWEETVVSLFGSMGDITHWDFSRLGKSDGVIGGLADIASQTVLPGFLIKPIVDVKRNKNFFGGPIYKESFDGEDSVTPEWQNTIGNSTLPIYIKFSKSMNELAGGNDEYGAGHVYRDSNGVIKPNITENTNSLFDFNPQAMQYIISQSLPFMQYIDTPYKAYENAERDGKDEIPTSELFSILPKGLQLDKIFYKEFPKESITANGLIYGAKKYFNTIKAIKDSGDTPKTKEQAQELMAWNNIKFMQNDVKKLRKAAQKADEAGRDDLARALSKKMDERMVQIAVYLYQLETERDLHDSQKAVKHWFENLTK